MQQLLQQHSEIFQNFQNSTRSDPASHCFGENKAKEGQRRSLSTKTQLSGLWHKTASRIQDWPGDQVCTPVYPVLPYIKANTPQGCLKVLKEAGWMVISYMYSFFLGYFCNVIVLTYVKTVTLKKSPMPTWWQWWITAGLIFRVQEGFDSNFTIIAANSSNNQDQQMGICPQIFIGNSRVEGMTNNVH